MKLTMQIDTIVDSPPSPVMYVAGDRSRPIGEQAPAAVDELETSLSSLRARKFYGVVVDGEYRACVRVRSDEDINNLKYPSFTISGGVMFTADWWTGITRSN